MKKELSPNVGALIYDALNSLSRLLQGVINESPYRGLMPPSIDAWWAFIHDAHQAPI